MKGHGDEDEELPFSMMVVTTINKNTIDAYTNVGMVCCSVLQCVAVCCSVLNCVLLQCVAVWCSVLQCVAVCCSVLNCVLLQCVAVCESEVEVE